MLKTVITLVTLFTVLSAKKKKISNIEWELARVEGATDLGMFILVRGSARAVSQPASLLSAPLLTLTLPGIVLGHPAAIKAAKMNIMMQRQDVVATCRYILFKQKLSYWDAREACRKVHPTFYISSEPTNFPFSVARSLCSQNHPFSHLINNEFVRWSGPSPTRGAG